MTIADKRFTIEKDEFSLPVVDFISNTEAGVINLAQDYYDILESSGVPELLKVIKASNLKDLVKAAATGKTNEYIAKFGAVLENGVMTVKKKLEDKTTQVANSYINKAADAVNNNINRAISSPSPGVNTAVNTNSAQSSQSFDLGSFLKNFGGSAQTSSGTGTLDASDKISLVSLMSDITSGSYKASVHDPANNSTYISGIVKTAANNGLNGFYYELAAMTSDPAKLEKAGISKNDIVMAGVMSLREAAGRGDVNTIIDISKSVVASDIRAVVPGIVSELYDAFPSPGDIPESQIDAYYSKLRSALSLLDPSWSSAKPAAGYFDQRVTKNTTSFMGLFPLAPAKTPATYSFTIGEPTTNSPELAAAKVTESSDKQINTTKDLVSSFYEGGG